MSVSESIIRVRKFIRDPSSKVFSDSQLLRLYNQCRRKFFLQSKCRVRGAFLCNPPIIFYSVSGFWERGVVEDYSSWYPFYEDSINNLSMTQPWEVQQSHGLTATEAGGNFIPNPADAAYAVPINLIYYPLPSDYNSPLFVAWQGKEVLQQTRDELQSYDTNWRTRQSNEVRFFITDLFAGEKGLVPYPHPTSESRTSYGGEGFPIYVSGSGFTWAESGDDPIATGASSLDPEGANDGIIAEVGSVEGGFTLFFYACPTDISDSSLEDKYVPRPFRKLLEYATAARALQANSELANEQRASFFDALYQQGMETIKKLKVSQLGRIETRLQGVDGMKSRHRLRRPIYPETIVESS